MQTMEPKRSHNVMQGWAPRWLLPFADISQGLPEQAMQWDGCPLGLGLVVEDS